MLVRMKIVALDIGLVSLGWCVFTPSSSKLTFGVANLKTLVPKKAKHDYALMAKRFLDEYKSIFQGATMVVLERQISAKFRVMTTALRCFLWGRHLVVSPIVVKRFWWGTPTGSYAKNKDLACDVALELLDATQRIHFKMHRKKARTDMADAILMAFWYAYVHALKKVPRHVEEVRCQYKALKKDACVS